MNEAETRPDSGLPSLSPERAKYDSEAVTPLAYRSRIKGFVMFGISHIYEEHYIIL